MAVSLTPPHDGYSQWTWMPKRKRETWLGILCPVWLYPREWRRKPLTPKRSLLRFLFFLSWLTSGYLRGREWRQDGQRTLTACLHFPSLSHVATIRLTWKRREIQTMRHHSVDLLSRLYTVLAWSGLNSAFH